MVISDPRSPKSTSNLVNSIPRSVVRLENFYEMHDKFRGTVNFKMNISSLIYETVNLGTKENPQNINASTLLLTITLILLVSKFKTVFIKTCPFSSSAHPAISLARHMPWLCSMLLHQNSNLHFFD